MNTEELLNSHASIKQKSGFAEQHRLVSLEFSIDLLRKCRDNIFNSIMDHPDPSNPHTLINLVYHAFDKTLSNLEIELKINS